MEAIVIGASAGGPAALQEIMAGLRPDLQVAVIVVIHVNADMEDLMSPLLESAGAWPVTTAMERTRIQAGHAYVAPPGYHLLIERDRHFSLSVDDRVLFSRPSIDVLFESAADAYGPGLAGVLLTGANADGAAGMKRIREAGGTALVQDPADARVPTMPQAALDLAGADLCAPLPGLVAALNRMCRP
ncbi:chemotaxis protein CheB [Xanthobacter sp. DSM 24535]|uniref:chemotaxis protein CheB n=1 Tax=Roseixanthobacter psychrophilus TaxID=3119917 RepID=UPI003728CCB9